MTAAQNERCENCGDWIGALETPMVFDGHVVCTDCHHRLTQKHKSRIGVLERNAETNQPTHRKADTGHQQVAVQELLRCVRCGSSNIQKLSIIHAGGTSVAVSQTAGNGVALTEDGIVPVLTHSSSRSVQRTDLAARAAPPIAPDPVDESPHMIAIVATIILPSVFAVAAGAGGIWPLWLVAGLFLALGVAAIRSAAASVAAKKRDYTAQMIRHRRLMSEWQRRFLCLKCGSVFNFEHGEADPTL